MASTIMRSELMGRKLTGHSGVSSRGSLVLLAIGFQYDAVAELRWPDARAAEYLTSYPAFPT